MESVVKENCMFGLFLLLYIYHAISGFYFVSVVVVQFIVLKLHDELSN